LVGCHGLQQEAGYPERALRVPGTAKPIADNGYIRQRGAVLLELMSLNGGTRNAGQGDFRSLVAADLLRLLDRLGVDDLAAVQIAPEKLWHLRVPADDNHCLVGLGSLDPICSHQQRPVVGRKAHLDFSGRKREPESGAVLLSSVAV